MACMPYTHNFRMGEMVMKKLIVLLLIAFMLSITAPAFAVTKELCQMTFNALNQYPNFINIQVNGVEANVFVHPLLWEMMPDDQKVGLMECAKISNNVQKVLVLEINSGKELGVLEDYMSGNYQIY